MLTVRHIGKTHEQVFEADEVWTFHNEKGREEAHAITHKDQGDRIFDSGRVYVMNESGATVWDIYLGRK
jgi:hypothetical protein